MNLYTLRVDIDDGPMAKEFYRKKISRTIMIGGDQTLETLHKAIFEAFDRSEERLHEFNLGEKPFDRKGKRYTPYEYYDESGRDEIDSLDTAATDMDSLELTEGRVFHYVFDFGDYWTHRIMVVTVEQAAACGDFPQITERLGDSPPQYPYPDAGPGEAPASMEEAGMLDAMMEHLQSQWREEVERKTLRPNTGLQAALNKLPATWVKAICRHVGLPGFRRSKERVTALVEHLPRIESLESIWGQLPEASRRMLKWIAADEEGAAAVEKLSEKFGHDTDRSWYWDEGEIPLTPLGLLRLHGLVFICTFKKNLEKVAVVPLELRDGLRRLSDAPNAFNDKPPLPSPPQESSPSFKETDMAKYLQEIMLGGPKEELAELEKFLEKCPFSRATEWLYRDVLKNVSSRPRDFHPDTIRELLDQTIKGGRADSRLLAYKLGGLVFGEKFVKPALKDESSRIRQYAQEIVGDARN